MIIDETSLTQTAEVLETLNPGRSSAAHIRDRIRASIERGENTYISTCGWVAFTWLNPQTLETHVKVAVAPYTVQMYLKK